MYLFANNSPQKGSNTIHKKHINEWHHDTKKTPPVLTMSCLFVITPD